jgi:hypothetical protein
MKEPYEKGIANHSAPSFAASTARCLVKRKQGYGWAGYRASKNNNRDADAVVKAEGNMHRGWQVERYEDGYPARFSGFTIVCEYLSALRIRSMGGRLAQEVCARRCRCGQVCGRQCTRVSAHENRLIFHLRVQRCKHGRLARLVTYFERPFHWPMLINSATRIFYSAQSVLETLLIVRSPTDANIGH